MEHVAQQFVLKISRCIMLRTLLITLIFGLSVRCDVCSSGCRRSRVHGMLSADCYDAKLREVPQCLKSDIQILDLSFNRIRKIKREDLTRYSSLQYLYLSDNMIIDIEDEALTDKTSLETLDISINSFSKIPPVVFHLPSLRRLYMSQNQNTNIVEDIEKSKPITSPLIKLDISQNNFKQLPNFGTLPTLIFYNISGNAEHVQMDTSHFAGLCRLKTLAMLNTTAVFQADCDCWILKNWLLERKVTFDDFICEYTDCPLKVPEADMQIYNKCLEEYDSAMTKNRLLTIALPMCLIITTVTLFIVIYICVKRKRQKKITKIKILHDSEGLLKL